MAQLDHFVYVQVIVERMEGEATAEVFRDEGDEPNMYKFEPKVRVERVQVEIASGANWHPGADLYSFTKVGQSFRNAKYVLLCQGPCLGTV